MSSPEAQPLKDLIRTIPHYPKPGIMFKDITTLLADAEGLRRCVHALAEPFRDAGLDHVAGIEARGFILGAPVAVELGVGFIPIRKKGKLPGEVIGEDYTLEYGIDTVEMHVDAFRTGDRVLLIDDLVATGGTAQAGAELLKRAKADVVAAAFVIDLPYLGGADSLRTSGLEVHTLLEFEAD